MSKCILTKKKECYLAFERFSYFEYIEPSLIRLQLIRVEIWKILLTVQYILQETHGIKTQEGLKQQDFQTVLKAAWDTETTQENIQNWLEGDSGFQLLVFL
jgi:hypothetical protein